MSKGSYQWTNMSNTHQHNLCRGNNLATDHHSRNHMSDGILSLQFQHCLRAKYVFPVVWNIIFDLHMHVRHKSMLKDALLKAEILSNAKYFHGLFSFYKIESLSGNLVHNSRKTPAGRSLKKKRKWKKEMLSSFKTL